MLKDKVVLKPYKDNIEGSEFGTEFVFNWKWNSMFEFKHLVIVNGSTGEL